MGRPCVFLDRDGTLVEDTGYVHEIERLVIVGLVTEMCVLFTAHDAYVRKFDLWVPEDCVASVDPAVHARTLQHLSGVLGIDTRSSVTAVGNTTADGCRAS